MNIGLFPNLPGLSLGTFSIPLYFSFCFFAFLTDWVEYKTNLFAEIGFRVTLNFHIWVVCYNECKSSEYRVHDYRCNLCRI